MANEQMRDLWTRYGGPGWTRNRDLFESAYAPFHEALLEAIGPVDGLTVLDVGCGTGGLSQDVIDGGGTVVGVDISETMIAGARAEVAGAQFVLADAQTAPLREYAPRGFDLVVSSFGVMFFDDPIAAFTNIAAAMKPDGRLVFMCWRAFDDNPNFTLGTHVLTERMPSPPPAPAPGIPGPTALADPELTTKILTDAGWSDVTLRPFDAECNFSVDGSDGVEERMAIIQGTTAGQRAAEQLMPTIGEEGWARLLDEVRADLRANLVDGVVKCPGAVWLVSAAKSG